MSTVSEPREGNVKAPVKRIRVGSCVASIFANETDKSRIYYGTSVGRSFKDEHGEYQESHSYLDGQLLELAKVADLAHAWIVERLAEDRAERRV